MQLTETIVRPIEGGLSIEMTLGEPGAEERTPYIRCLVHLEPYPEGRLPLQEWQRAALTRVLDELRAQISHLSAT